MANSGLHTQASLESILPREIIACVRSPQSAERLRLRFQHCTQVKICTGSCASAAEACDVVVLACKASQIASILSSETENFHSAVSGKLLLSFVGGMPASTIHQYLYGSCSYNEDSRDTTLKVQPCHIKHVVPNAFAEIRKSATIFCRSPFIPESFTHLALGLMRTLGNVTHVSEHSMNAATVLGGCSPAYLAFFLEGLIEGVVARGMDVEAANEVGAGMMEGVAGMMRKGMTTREVIGSISTAGDATHAGLERLEKTGVQVAAKNAVEDGTALLDSRS